MDTEAAKGLIEKVLSASQIGVKRVWVGRSGSLLLTFYSVKAAREALTLIGQFASNIKLADGYDDTPKGYARVWRISALMGA